jgi:hypothetical protein
MPSSGQLYELLMGSDPIALWLWWRAVDWALYRVRMGQPIARSCQDWDVPTAKLSWRRRLDRRSPAGAHR